MLGVAKSSENVGSQTFKAGVEVIADLASAGLNVSIFHLTLFILSPIFTIQHTRPTSLLNLNQSTPTAPLARVTSTVTVPPSKPSTHPLTQYHPTTIPILTYVNHQQSSRRRPLNSPPRRDAPRNIQLPQRPSCPSAIWYPQEVQDGRLQDE